MVFILDNLNAHSSDLVMREMQDENTEIIFNAPYAPELSPVENYFCRLKHVLKDIEFANKLELT